VKKKKKKKSAPELRALNIRSEKRSGGGISWKVKEGERTRPSVPDKAGKLQSALGTTWKLKDIFDISELIQHDICRLCSWTILFSLNSALLCAQQFSVRSC